ncbi:hypothetical protein HY745_14045, partial [Candidatus Desantisbacteria bacterium]|nr:hypothetical protein [Candidatus Desantisbacteria bacterium]
MKYFSFHKIIFLLLIFTIFLPACQRKLVRAQKFPEKFYNVIPIDASGEFIVEHNENTINMAKNDVKI